MVDKSFAFSSALSVVNDVCEALIHGGSGWSKRLTQHCRLLVDSSFSTYTLNICARVSL